MEARGFAGGDSEKAAGDDRRPQSLKGGSSEAKGR